MSKSVIVSQLGSIRTEEMVNSYIESFKTFMVEKSGHGYEELGF